MSNDRVRLLRDDGVETLLYATDVTLETDYSDTGDVVAASYGDVLSYNNKSSMTYTIGYSGHLDLFTDQSRVVELEQELDDAYQLIEQLQDTIDDLRG